jgi:chorismate--pyruvate lyase
LKRAPSSARSSVLRQWLSAPGSLSRRLAAMGTRFEVQTLQQGAARLCPIERIDLAPHAQGRGWVREVLLRVDGEPLVWARSVVPSVALKGPWRALLGLGSRPLADLLFNEPRVTRTPLRRERVALGGPLHRRLARQWQAANGTDLPRGMMWARSSVFRKRGVPLRVMEVFSPWFAGVAPHTGHLARIATASRTAHVGPGSSHANPA